MKRRTSRSVKLRRKSRRRNIGTFFCRIVCVLLILGAGALALTIFFKVNQVTVTGNTRYTAAQISQTIGAEKGDNLFFWGKATGKQRVLREYPYISSVRVRRKMPDTLCVEVTECAAFAALEDGAGGCYLISSAGKVLEKVENAAAVTVPRITGVSLGDRQVGEVIGGAEDNAERTLLTLLTALSGTGQMKNVDFINLTNAYDIHIGYLKRFDVRLGSTEELARKLQFLNKIVAEKLSPSDVGVIELSNVARMYFWPDTPENVKAASGQAAPAAKPAPAANPAKPAPAADSANPAPAANSANPAPAAQPAA